MCGDALPLIIIHVISARVQAECQNRLFGVAILELVLDSFVGARNLGRRRIRGVRRNGIALRQVRC